MAPGRRTLQAALRARAAKPQPKKATRAQGSQAPSMNATQNAPHCVGDRWDRLPAHISDQAQMLSFRAASQALSLTQSAVSRQIQALEDEVGVPCFAATPAPWSSPARAYNCCRRWSPPWARGRRGAPDPPECRTAHRVDQHLVVFCLLWLIPRLADFHLTHPDIDIRINATDVPVDLETADVDVALRYAFTSPGSAHAQQLFGEQLTAVASPALLRQTGAIHRPSDLAHHALIEAGMARRSPHMEWLSWQRWLEASNCSTWEPVRWLYFNYAHQIAQAALAGQGVALARMPLVADSLAQENLVEVLPGTRLDSPMAYWLLVGTQSAPRRNPGLLPLAAPRLKPPAA